MSFSRILRATGHLAAAILASAAYVKRADSEFQIETLLRHTAVAGASSGREKSQS